MRHPVKIFALFLTSVGAFGVLTLAACSGNSNWTPTVDLANDPKAATLDADMLACHDLATEAGHQAVTTRSRSLNFGDDGNLVNSSAFRRAYSRCLKMRGHPVVS